MGVQTIHAGKLDLQYCFYINLMWGLSGEHREQLMERYWCADIGKDDWVPTLSEIRAKCSAILLEKTPEKSAKSIGDLFLGVLKAGSEQKA
jgi:hypothetical protein